MKIIFDSEEQKNEFLKELGHSEKLCPDDIGLRYNWCRMDCQKCWEQAIECEVADES